MLALLAITLSAYATVAAAVQAHRSGGQEHIVLIDNAHPAPPQVEEVLERLALNQSHPDVLHVYNNSAFRGFSASMKSHCLDLLANMTDVSIVEQAITVTSSLAIKKRNTQYYDTRPNAPWGLQRISTASVVDGNAKAMDYTYSFANSALGKGADVYIVDTGIYIDHAVFGGRAKMAWSYDGNMTDIDGHGTHVSGTAAGETLGVASNANIFGVRALDGEGSGWSSNVVAGIDYIIQQHDARKAASGDFVGSVLSMSLASSGQVDSINQAITAAIKAGVHSVLAAGNAGEEACGSSPASAGGTNGPAITVGSVDIAAKRSSFSNYGNCVDVYAPGENIISSWIGAPNMVNVLSGTSMATPHVTGIVAYAMANSTLAANPGLMKEWIQMNAIQMSDGTLLANNGVKAVTGEGMLGFMKVSARPSWLTANGERSVPDAQKEKRGIGEGLSSAVSGLEKLWQKLFGHHKRGLGEGLSSTEKRGIGEGLSSFVSGLEKLWRKVFGHHKRGLEELTYGEQNDKRGIGEGLSSALSALERWWLKLFGHHKRGLEELTYGEQKDKRGIGEGLSSALSALERWWLKLFGHHKRGLGEELISEKKRGIGEGLSSAVSGLEKLWHKLFGRHSSKHKRGLGDGLTSLVSGLERGWNNLHGHH